MNRIKFVIFVLACSKRRLRVFVWTATMTGFLRVSTIYVLALINQTNELVNPALPYKRYVMGVRIVYTKVRVDT